ncbi:MAG: hypothetical protein JXR76_20790 [Deltaproteobacteria bacterium]|nr:hypothetical protein [Deltaproteobacteria bacterium]
MYRLIYRKKPCTAQEKCANSKIDKTFKKTSPSQWIAVLMFILGMMGAKWGLHNQLSKVPEDVRQAKEQLTRSSSDAQ